MLSTLLNLGNLISSIKVTYSEKKDDVETGVTLANVKKQEDKIKKEVDGARHKISTLLKEHTFSSEGILRFPIDLGGTNHLMPFIRYKPYNYAAGYQKEGLEKSAGSIYLPMTPTVTQNTNPNWAQETDILSQFTAVDTEEEQGGGGKWSRAGSAVTAGVVKGAAKIVQSVTSALNAPDIIKATMRRAGATFNPFNERFFDGVSYRVYSFEHKFLPESPKETAVVFNIIRRFQFFSLPDYAVNKNFLTYPSLWRIGFFQEDSNRNQFLPILDDCVVTLVGVVFGGGGTWAELKAGEPVEVTLSLQVTETTIPTKSRMLNEEHKHTRTRAAEQQRRQLDFGRVTWGAQSSIQAHESTGIYAGPDKR